MAKLTKKMLQGWGVSVMKGFGHDIIIIRWDPKEKEYYVVKQNTNENGYKFFQFQDNGNHVNLYVHRAVWAWFSGECPDDMAIDHINGHRWDNHPSNLQCITTQQNLSKRDARNRYTAHLTATELEAWHKRKAELIADRKQIDMILSDLLEKRKKISLKFHYWVHECKPQSLRYREQLKEITEHIAELRARKKKIREELERIKLHAK